MRGIEYMHLAHSICHQCVCMGDRFMDSCLLVRSFILCGNFEYSFVYFPIFQEAISSVLGWLYHKCHWTRSKNEQMFVINVYVQFWHLDKANSIETKRLCALFGCLFLLCGPNTPIPLSLAVMAGWRFSFESRQFLNQNHFTASKPNSPKYTYTPQHMILR